MRRLGCVLVVAAGLGGCAELGTIPDGTSISMGRPSNGFLAEGRRLPNDGEGFTTKPTWRARGNRFGTDELVDLITGVGRRLATRGPGPRLVVADLSMRAGGEARRWHRSHQSGRDVDLVYFSRDADGKAEESSVMRKFDPLGVARDGSGATVDVPRMWRLVRELVMAPEATVQRVFLYEPLTVRLLEHAVATGEPEAVVARARLALKQPGDSAPHDDHVHVRIYCSERDRPYGCVDIGPVELLWTRLAERDQHNEQLVLDILAAGRRASARPSTVARTDAPLAIAPLAIAPLASTAAFGAQASTRAAAAGATPELTSFRRLVLQPLAGSIR